MAKRKENADECKYAALEAQQALEQIARKIQSFFSKYSVISLLLLHMTPVEIKVDKESFSIGRVEVLLFFLAKESPNLISWLTLS